MHTVLQEEQTEKKTGRRGEAGGRMQGQGGREDVETMRPSAILT